MGAWMKVNKIYLAVKAKKLILVKGSEFVGNWF